MPAMLRKELIAAGAEGASSAAKAAAPPRARAPRLPCSRHSAALASQTRDAVRDGIRNRCAASGAPGFSVSERARQECGVGEPTGPHRCGVARSDRRVGETSGRAALPWGIDAARSCW